MPAHPFRSAVLAAVLLAAVLVAAGCSQRDENATAIPFSLGGSSMVYGFTPTPTAFVPVPGKEASHEGHSAEATQAPASGPEAGKKIYLSVGCTACHTIEGLSGGQVGPNLTHVASTAGKRVPGLDAEAYFRKKETTPGFNTVEGFPAGMMPALVKPGPDMDALVAFLLTRQ